MGDKTPRCREMAEGFKGVVTRMLWVAGSPGSALSDPPWGSVAVSMHRYERSAWGWARCPPVAHAILGCQEWRVPVRPEGRRRRRGRIDCVTCLIREARDAELSMTPPVACDHNHMRCLKTVFLRRSVTPFFAALACAATGSLGGVVVGASARMGGNQACRAIAAPCDA